MSRLTMSKVFFVVAFCVLLLSGLSSGHGLVKSPATRNSIGSTGHGANGSGVCGLGGDWSRPGVTDDSQVDGPATGPIQVYQLGEVFEVVMMITAPHKGHIQMELCRPNGNKITQDCFKTLLKRDPSDSRYSPYFKDYPHIFFFPEDQCARREDLKARFIIPAEFGTCEHCIIRWYWQTGNSCYSHDYQRSEISAAPAEYLNWGSEGCRLPQVHYYGSCGSNCPHPGCSNEQFKNCIDVKIVGGDGSVPTSNGNKPEAVEDTPIVNNNNNNNNNSQDDGDKCDATPNCVQQFGAERCDAFCCNYCEVSKRYSKNWCTGY